MKKIIAVLALLLFALPGLSQITIDSEWDDDGNLTFFSQNTTIIPYSVLFDFSELQNLSSAGGRYVTSVAMPGRSRLTTLKVKTEGVYTNFKFSTTYIKGNVFGKSKEEPVYIVPVQEGVNVSVDFLTPLESVLGQEVKGSAYRGVMFNFEVEAMIVAPRKGIVSAIKMQENNDSKNLSYTEEENMIELYHEDGTLTQLKVLKSNSQKVKLGQMVFPGDILAESAGENYVHGRHVRMICLKLDRITPDQLNYTNIPVTFSTPSGSHKFVRPEVFPVVWPKEIITAELNKKELKAFQERK